MGRDQLLELETLAARHSPEILRMLPYLTLAELRGHLAYLRRLEAESDGA